MGDAPNSELPAMRVLLVIINSPPPDLPKFEEWTPEFRQFVNDCLQKDPVKRLSITDIMKQNKKFFDKAKGPEFIVQNFL